MEIGSLVFVKGYEELGKGRVEYINENDEYPVCVYFLDEGLHESENSGCFEKELIMEVQ